MHGALLRSTSDISQDKRVRLQAQAQVADTLVPIPSPQALRQGLSAGAGKGAGQEGSQGMTSHGDQAQGVVISGCKVQLEARN